MARYNKWERENGQATRNTTTLSIIHESGSQDVICRSDRGDDADWHDDRGKYGLRDNGRYLSGRGASTMTHREEITDSDYPPVLKVIKKQLWPVSWIDDEGVQCDSVWTHDPSRGSGGEEFWVGETFFVETLHPAEMSDKWKADKIAALKAEIEKLKGEV